MSEGFNINNFLRSAVAAGASDEHLMVGHAPYVRKEGFIMKTKAEPVTKENLENAILEMVSSSVRESVLNSYDLDFMYEIKGCSRFRVNYGRTVGMPSLVIRNIPYTISDLNDLSLPDIISQVVNYKNGIVLVTGPTGSGKSTTLASLINKIAKEKAVHIITIEDPIEYVFSTSKSIISQRQIGVDTSTFSDGIKYALRQDPDVIFIGEIRDEATMSAALKAAETGHLVFSTLHTNDAVQTINRIINMFDLSVRDLAKRQLAETLRATISQKLVYSEKNQKRYPACEVLVVTPAIKDYMTKGNTEDIYTLLGETNIDNMMSMNMSLATLVQDGCITEEEALAASNDEAELEKMFRGVYQGTRNYYEE